MKRNFSGIRDYLRKGSPLDQHNIMLCADMTVDQRTQLTKITDQSWNAICDKAKRAGFYHSDIQSPALPFGWVLEAAWPDQPA